MARVRLSPEKRRLQLLKALKKVIAKDGFSMVTIPEVVKTANVAQGTFYHYFSNMEDALLQLADQLTGPFYRMINTVDFTTGHTVDDFRQLIFKLYLTIGEQLHQNGEVFREILLAGAGSRNTLHGKIFKFLGDMHTYIHDIIVHLEGKSPFRTLDPDITPGIILGMIIGGIFNHKQFNNEKDIVKWAEEMTAFEIGGLLDYE